MLFGYKKKGRMNAMTDQERMPEPGVGEVLHDLYSLSTVMPQCGTICKNAVDCIKRLEREKSALRAQEQNELMVLTGTRRIGEIITGRIVALDAEKGLASIHWEPYAHEPTRAPDKGDPHE